MIGKASNLLALISQKSQCGNSSDMLRNLVSILDQPWPPSRGGSSAQPKLFSAPHLAVAVKPKKRST